MRALFVTPGTQDGGTERCFTTVCEAAQKAGWALTVAIGAHAAPAFRQRLQELSITPVEGEVSTSPWDARAAMRAQPALLRRCANQAFDVVWFALPWATVAILERTSLARRLPVVSSFFLLDPQLASRRRRLVDRWTWHVGTQTTTTLCRADQTLVHQAFRLPTHRIAVVPPAVTLPAALLSKAAARTALAVASDHFVVATLARLEPQKALETLIHAAARCTIPKVLFLVAGEGSLQAALQSQIDRQNLRTRIRLLGVTDPSLLLAAADAFVLPSRFEGVPLAILEALNANVPVIASAVGGISEMLEEGRAGMLVEPASAPAIVMALHTLYRSPVPPNELQRRAARARQLYSVENFQRSMLEVLTAATVGTSIDAPGRRPKPHKPVPGR